MTISKHRLPNDYFEKLDPNTYKPIEKQNSATQTTRNPDNLTPSELHEANGVLRIGEQKMCEDPAEDLREKIKV